MSSEKYIGLDVHQATISVAVMDSQGKIIMESILENQSLYSSGVLRWTARELVCDLRRRRLGRGWKIAKVDGAQNGHSFELVVAQGMGLRAGKKVRFAGQPETGDDVQQNIE